jgi:ubiquinone/menaquinone biosynthesis C-methylase UbiE
LPDFVTSNGALDEHAHYESLYRDSSSVSGRDFGELESCWSSLYYPSNRILFEKLGDLRNRRVLLLGNGTSEKELSLVTQEPELIVLSDVSPSAVRHIRDRYDLEPVRSKIIFAAIDAQDLPLADESVDVVYGCALAHHLPDLDAFLSETVRVLRPGGRAVFMDDAYAPLWQFAKRTILRPLMHYFHRLEPPSPEDLKFTLRGGFREEDLAPRIDRLGAQPWFERGGFVHYLVTRASERLPPRRLLRQVRASEQFLGALIRIDSLLADLPIIRHNQIRLVWGFDKNA